MKLLKVTFFEKYLFAWLRDVFIPLGIINCLYLVVQYRKWKYYQIFLIFLLLGLVNNSLTIAKAPTAALFLSIAAFIFIKSKRISLKYVIISVATIFSFPYLVIHLVTPPEFRAPSNLLNSLFLRVFVVPAEALYQYFEVFPSKHDFLIGKGSKLFSWLHHEGLFNAANYVAKIWWNDPTTTGNANANYLGTFWADFGWYGVIFSTILIGYIIHLFYWKLVVVAKYKKNMTYVSISSISVMMMSFTFISGNFTTILLTRGLLIMFLFVTLIQQIERKYETQDLYIN
ncbi:MAG: oligosaccharide repeat unit polymerase [Candidatus Marinimicrobia bacterium]|nr:oligosaccharide repeat unit polymerase [Candidatus Neomarinimicrobiota bacterium]